jgi:hypothetical protein
MYSYRSGPQLMNLVQRQIMGRPVSGVVANIAVTATSARSTVLTKGEQYSIVSTVNSWIKIATNDPTVVVDTDVYLPEGSVIKFVADVEGLKIAAIRATSATADGILSISVMSKVPG